MALRLATNPRNAMVKAATDLIDAGAAAGKVRIFSGSQPAAATDAATGTLLVEIPLADPAFVAGTAGVRTLTDPASVNATTAGVAGWARFLDSDNVTVFDMSVGGTGSGADIILSNVNLAVGQPVDISAGGTVTMPAG